MSEASADNNADAVLHRLKHELKDWECGFQKAHGRAPTRDDVALQPDIVRKYRDYSKLKTIGSDSKHAKRLRRRHTDFPSKPPLPPKRKMAEPQRRLIDEQKERQIRRASTLLLPTTVSTIAEEHSGHGDEIEATPKRRRTTAMIFSPIKQAAEPDAMEAEQQTPILQRNLFADMRALEESTVVGMKDVPPVPSLLRRQTSALSRSATIAARRASAGPFSSVSSTSSLSSLGEPEDPKNRRRTLIGSMRTLDLGVESFRARAGKLVKTTSIPLSAFGAQFRGASQLLAPSQSGHVSDGGDGLDTSHAGVYEDLCDADLVEETSNDNPAGAVGSGDAEISQERTRKKTTQKRSTRRVKLRPVDHDGNAKARKGSENTQGLVSNNFYKLRLRKGKRGAPSADERRTAMYKRMVSGKNRRERAAVAKEKATAEDDDAEHPDDDDEFDGAFDEDLGEEAEVAGEPKEGEVASPVLAEDVKRQDQLASRLIAGKPQSFFSADESSAEQYSCTVNQRFTNGHTVKLDLLKVLKHVWGHDQFRFGQAEAIKRVLDCRSTLLLLSTGSGKSLAYQLPSLLLSSLSKGLTLVVTPLISLMRDQIKHLPKELQAICMSLESGDASSHSSMLQRLASGQVQLVFVSPERLASPQFHDLMVSERTPQVQLAVVDEAHCASEWSHNFRPAYFQVPHALRSLSVPCVLAMTGTATSALATQICHMFGIDAAQDVIRGSVVRSNISLSVVPVYMGTDTRMHRKSCAREEALLGILRQPEMASLDSILVYVATQATADRVAEYLTARSIPAQAYHAGKPAAERTRIQTAFMQESPRRKKAAIRVLVATVAFGM
ncbi:hypothetical protein FBU59_001516, partial [Linderina macrospora]